MSSNNLSKLAQLRAYHGVLKRYYLIKYITGWGHDCKREQLETVEPIFKKCLLHLARRIFSKLDLNLSSQFKKGSWRDSPVFRLITATSLLMIRLVEAEFWGFTFCFPLVPTKIYVYQLPLSTIINLCKI